MYIKLIGSSLRKQSNFLNVSLMLLLLLTLSISFTNAQSKTFIFLPFCSSLTISPTSKVLSSNSLSLTISAPNTLWVPKTDQYYQLNTLPLSDAVEKIKLFVILVDPNGNSRAPSSVSIVSSSSFSVQFTGLASNSRYALFIAHGLAYLDLETPSIVQLILFSSQSIYNYATGSGSIESFTLQNSYESSLGQFCLSKLNPYTLVHYSQQDNVQTSIFSSPFLQSQKLILNGKWNGKESLHNISEFVSNGYTYQLKSNIDIQFQELVHTQIVVPLQFKRHLGAVYENIDIDDTKITDRPADAQELESMFDRVHQETLFYKASIDPNSAPVSQTSLTGAAAETNVAILLTYTYYLADFYDWYGNALTRVTIKSGIIRMISISEAGLNYFTCPYGSLRGEYQHFTQRDSYHSIGYSSIHAMYGFGYSQKSFKINTQVNIDTNGMVGSLVSLSNFENSQNCANGNFKVTLSDNVITDYESFFTDNFMISKIDTRKSIQSIENFTLLYVDDLGSEYSGPLITPETFVGDLVFNPGYCDEPIGTRLGNQLTYYFSSNAYSVERFPEYSTRLSYDNGVVYNIDSNSIDLKYSNHEYLQDFSIEIDQSILLYKEPKVSNVNFTLIPNRSEWNEMNATVEIFSYNSGDWSGEFTVELSCSSPILILNADPQKFILEPGQNLTAIFKIRSDFDSCKTVSLQSSCNYKISIKKEALWTNLEKEITGHESVSIDYGYFIPRCQAKYNEPFLWLENMTLQSNYFQRTSNDGFVNSILVLLKTNSSDLILSNIATAMIADSNNPFHSWNDYVIVMKHAEYFMLNFTISSSSISRILSERIDQTMYSFSLNITLLDHYICWSSTGKGGLFPFSFSVMYDCPVEYTGIQCNIPICYGINATNYTNVCSGHGECTSPDYCVCNANYTSSNCSIPICFGIRGDNSSTCSSKGECIDANTCKCQSGYTGSNCEIPVCFNVPANFSNSCYGNGQCIDHDLCKCNQGYTSLNCSLPICYEIDSSQSMVCSSHGQCLFPNNCSCFDGFTTENCSIPICFGIDATNASVCNGFGQCISPNICNCKENHIGSECEIPKCFTIPSNDSRVCSSHGYCQSVDECICFEGYTVIDCSIPICFGINATNYSKVCNNGHGKCIEKNNCECNVGYTGLECQVPICFDILGNSSLVCSGHGSCNGYNNCSCLIDYVDDDCSIPLCFGLNSTDSSVCSTHGDCIAPNNCTCHEGYTSTNCSIPVCFNIEATNSSVCNTFGECKAPNQCSCFNNHIGQECEIPLCFGIPSNESDSCNGNGHCTAIDSCVCYQNFTGLNCSIPLCFGFNASDIGNVCNGHGSCLKPDSCQCFEGYTDSQCETPICFDIPASISHTCSGNGICKDHNTCNCSSGFTSPNCSIPICFGYNATDEMVCSSNGQCISPNNCSCNEGFMNSDCSHPICFGFESTNSNVCSSHGQCISPDSCQCDTNHVGKNCEIPICFGVPANLNSTCSGNGNCSSVNLCECYGNYTGENCLIPICFNENSTSLLSCSSRGRCIGPNLCECNVGYVGSVCEYPVCFGLHSKDENSCSGHGKCIDFDTCECESGYIADNCSTPVCFALNSTDSGVCSGHGICVSANNCSCYEGFTSENCSIPICFGWPSNTNQTCHSSGKCLSPDSCLCNKGYFGVDCGIPSCFGVLQNQSRVCSGNGNCVDYDVCTCYSNFTGENCAISSCFGVASNDSSVCSGRGICSQPNQCECEDHYSGKTCEISECFGIPSNESNVCSGHGECIAPNECECNPGYLGDSCSLHTCFGILFNQTNVCSGNGTCTSLNNCTCYGNVQSFENCTIIESDIPTIANSSNSNYTNDTERLSNSSLSYLTCFNISSNHTNVCNGNGNCTNENECKCREEYFGEDCSLFTCFGKPSNDSAACSLNGECISPNYCNCLSERFGPQCQLVKCFGILSNFSSVCSSKGFCQDTDVCLCKEGYLGPNCNITICNGITSNNSKVCNENGACSDYNTCQCKEGYIGSDCQFTKCNSTSCLNGNCVTASHCECESGWTSSKCNLAICHDLSASDMNVCSSHGNCIAPNLCNCSTNPLYMGSNCEFLQLDSSKCNINPSVNFVPIEWSITGLDKITLDLSSKDIIIRNSIPYSEVLHSKSKFNYEINISNIGKRYFNYQMNSYCNNGISFKQLGIFSTFGYLNSGDNVNVKDVNNLGFALFWNDLSVKYEDITCHIELILNPKDQFDECQNYDSSTDTSTKYNITLVFESTNVCQFLKETDLPLTFSSTQLSDMSVFELVDQNIPSDDILKLTNTFTQKRNNWHIFNMDNSTIQANILLTAQLNNPSSQIGLFVPTLQCKDDRIVDNIEFTTEYLSNQLPFGISHSLNRIQFHFNVSIKNVSNYVDYGRVRGGKEGMATVLIEDMILNCSLILLPNPSTCWSNSNRNSTLSKYIISHFTLPIVSGEFSFFQAVRSFEIGIITLTYTCMSIGFASMICTTKVPRDRKHSLLQLVEFVKEKRRNKLNSTTDDSKPLLENEIDRPFCENCGHSTRKKARYAIRVENYESDMFICENQKCFDAMISLHNRGYSHDYQCFDLDKDEDGQLMIETPFKTVDHLDESDIYESMYIEFPIPSESNEDDEDNQDY